MGGDRERAERGASLDFPRRECQFGGQKRHDPSLVRRFDRLWRFRHDRSATQSGRRAHGPYERGLNSKRSSAEVQSSAPNPGPVRERLGSLTLMRLGIAIVTVATIVPLFSAPRSIREIDFKN